ncbi:DUF1049 domain-containing protein [Altererythrobacter aquiaggeris]|uniref:DUF1049 domain-containing protein n=1 Tax=Aestuarierythrobacter aquiaggeris TaxID=1898396 RepID=UPI003019EB94
MQIVRSLIWILILVGLIAFSLANWNPVEVKIWENLILETKVPALVIISFMLGLLPMWLVHRGTKWRLGRRISALEGAAQAYAVSASAPAVNAADVDAGDSVAPMPDRPAENADPDNSQDNGPDNSRTTGTWT